MAQAMAAGTVIAGAVRDEATTNLTGSAVEELRAIGVSTDLRNHFRSSHAFVGVVGASLPARPWRIARCCAHPPP